MNPIDFGTLTDWLVIGLAAGVSVTALLLLRWFGRRQVPRRKREVKTRHPIVLVHGFMGFDRIGAGPFRQDYFRRVPKRLSRLGIDVHCPRLPAAASIAERAQALSEHIRALSADRVNVVAHSMGGLDARYAVSKLGASDRVASLTTLGTPHRGSPIADIGATLGLGFALAAFRDLTTDRLAAFNREVEDVPSVAYASVVGAVNDGVRRVHPLLIPSYLYLRERVGPNDGLVPAPSQRWGTILREIGADHWAQIGWSRHFDAPAFFEELMRELRGLGF